MMDITRQFVKFTLGGKEKTGQLFTEKYENKRTGVSYESQTLYVNTKGGKQIRVRVIEEKSQRGQFWWYGKPYNINSIGLEVTG